jgi:hypothetical protein
MALKPKAPPVGFPPDTVMDIYLTDRTPRWVWGDVIAELRRRTQARVA